MPNGVRLSSADSRLADPGVAGCKKGVVHTGPRPSNRVGASSAEHELDPAVSPPHLLAGPLHSGHLLPAPVARQAFGLDTGLDEEALDRRGSSLAQPLVIRRG